MRIDIDENVQTWKTQNLLPPIGQAQQQEMIGLGNGRPSSMMISNNINQSSP
jgi:hypothetical protein